MTVDEHLERVEAALERQRQLAQNGAVTMTAETAWADAEALAAEVVRLRQIMAEQESRP